MFLFLFFNQVLLVKTLTKSEKERNFPNFLGKSLYLQGTIYSIPVFSILVNPFISFINKEKIILIFFIHSLLETLSILYPQLNNTLVHLKDNAVKNKIHFFYNPKIKIKHIFSIRTCFLTLFSQKILNSLFVSA